MWVNGVLVADYSTVRYRVLWDGTTGATMLYGTNFVMLSDFCSCTVPQTQSVYYDDVSMSVEGASASAPVRMRMRIRTEDMAALLLVPMMVWRGRRHGGRTI